MTPKGRESLGSPVRFGSRRDLVFSFFPSFGAFLGALGVFARYDLSSLARSSSLAQVAKIAKKSHFSFLLFLALFPFYAALCLLAFLAPLREMSFLAVRHPNEDVWQLLDCCLSTLRVVAEIRTDSRVCEDSDVLTVLPTQMFGDFCIFARIRERCLPQRRRAAEGRPRIQGKFGEKLNRRAEPFLVCFES